MSDEKFDLEPIKIDGRDLIGDGQAPLVVDLPDGQKIIVGNIDPGTVIEVATWRGTGRPDSRTNRIMLGVSINEDFKKTLPKPDGEKFPEKTENNNSNLNQVRTGLNQDNLFPVTHYDDKPAPRKKFSRSKKFLKISLIIMLVVAITAGVSIPLNVGISHPKSGASTALGGADSTLVLIRRNSEFRAGDKVVSTIPVPSLNPAIGIVSASGQDFYLISTNKGYFQVKRSDIQGQVLAVLPLIGFVANLFD